MSTQKTAWLIVACCLLPFASEGLAQGELPGPPRMLTIVVSGEWGVARAANIEKLLSDVASHINGLLRTPWAGEVHVRSAPLSDPTPGLYSVFRKPTQSLFNSPARTVVGISMPTSLHMNSVMFYPVMRA